MLGDVVAEGLLLEAQQLRLVELLGRRRRMVARLLLLGRAEIDAALGALRESEEAAAAIARELASSSEVEADLEIDEDFLRRIREV